MKKLVYCLAIFVFVLVIQANSFAAPKIDNLLSQKIAAAPLSPFIGPDAALRGLALEDGSLWLLSNPLKNGRAFLQRVPLSRLDWSTAP